MKIYKISQNFNTGYNFYDSAIVCAESEAEAISIRPHSGFDFMGEPEINGDQSWCEKEHIKVEYIGDAVNQKKGVLCASFNAG